MFPEHELPNLVGLLISAGVIGGLIQGGKVLARLSNLEESQGQLRLDMSQAQLRNEDQHAVILGKVEHLQEIDAGAHAQFETQLVAHDGRLKTVERNVRQILKINGGHSE